MVPPAGDVYNGPDAAGVVLAANLVQSHIFQLSSHLEPV
jgi:hypothetical protein